MSGLSGTMDSTAALVGRVRPLPAIADLREQWQSLEAESDCSFFQSWDWMGTWLEGFADCENMQLFECMRGGNLVGLALVGTGKIRRRGVFTSSQVVLNESADPSRNMLVEYNEPLCARGEHVAVIDALFRALEAVRGWDEFRVPYGREDHWSRHMQGHAGLCGVVDWTVPSWIAPLDASTTIETILAGLSSNRRQQLRRTIREFEKTGPLTLTVAGGAEEALSFFRELGDLHTRRWKGKGEEGAFANPAWVHFHEALISKGVASGRVQVLRIRSGSENIGYIYNLLWRGAVLMLQTGFVQESSNLKRPGYVSHMLAMQFNARMGMKLYDFLPGNDEYKRVLAAPGPSFSSIRFQRRRLKFRIEHGAVAVVRAFRAWKRGGPR